MKYKELMKHLGFIPKENTFDIYQKKYSSCQDYCIEIDFKDEKINYGNLIALENKTIQNFSPAENWVTLECVDRLLEKGYLPQNIILEKSWRTGHGTSGRLDILVTHADGSAYLMIECKTWGIEFDKELKNLERNGGQLFTYFQQDKDADILILYTSQLQGNTIEYRNIIIKIEEDYRQAGNVKDFFERWNKLPKINGIFDNWVMPYEFQSKALTRNDLKILKQEDSSFIFNRFLEILRHNVVSDKPNAFNKIFTLFLCKIVDENRNSDEQLHFQWLEGEDDHISFQKRLADLYNRGMLELLEKKVTDVSDSEFDKQFLQVETQYKERFKEILTEIRLKKNNEFAIKEVYDDASFEENAKVVKEVVELIQAYQIRYTYRQQFLSDFFELLLTTGLKQESGQFFTPVPIARFIIKSLPLQEITAQKIEQGNKNDLLPAIIDYAAGSGHFLTESMEEVQKYIDSLDESNFNPATKKAIKSWKEDQFNWAENYVYGIEKDYRLVKTAKVSCYLHGDGLAKVIHGDGLGDFVTSKEFKDLLKETDKTYPQDNKQFDVIISNPPYSVSAFKGVMNEEKAKIGFDLYDRLTDQSSEIECLFIERTKQLLKDGGVAGIILPSSILSNTGIYTQTREIILRHFEILGIAELGSNTFMATGTNTVTLFLRRRNNADAYNIEETIKKCFVSLQDLTVNGIEQPLKKYVAQVWDIITFEDYKTLLQKTPNENIKQHEIYKEYIKKIKAKNNQELWTNIFAIEQDKLLYFILAYPQKLVLVKTGEKNEEKRFLGYEFSNRRGSEGIHSMQKSKSIDECTQLYDTDCFTNPEKASTYIYKAFLGKVDLEIPENLQKNVSYHNLVDMFTFDRVDFEKNISLSAKKKVEIDSKWEIVRIKDLCEIGRGRVINKKEIELNFGKYPVYSSQTTDEGIFGYLNTFDFEGEYVTWTTDGIYAGSIFYRNGKFNCTNVCGTLKAINDNLNMQYLAISLPLYTKDYVVKVANPKLMNNVMAEIKISLPPLNIQQKIVAEIEALEKHERKVVEEILRLQKSVYTLLNSYSKKAVSEFCSIAIEKDNPQSNPEKEYIYIGLEHIESNTGKIILNTEIGRNILSTKNKFKKGDILYGKLRPYLNKVAEPNFDGICSTDILVLKTGVPSLLKYALRSDDFVKQTSDLMGGISLPRIKPKDFLNQKISFPPISEQKKIAAEIEKVETKMAELEQQIVAIPKQKEQVLRQYL